MTSSHLPELVCRTWHPGALRGIVAVPMPGCRGFIGPVPPPLWIRAMLFKCAQMIYQLAQVVKRKGVAYWAFISHESVGPVGEHWSRSNHSMPRGLANPIVFARQS